MGLKVIAFPPGGSILTSSRAPYGSLDSSFGSGGKVVTSFGTLQDIADAVAVKGNKIVVAGASKSLVTGNDFALARYNKDGSLDSSFGTGGKVTTDFNGGFDSANGVAFVGDDIVAAGYVDGLTPMSDFGLARYNTNGSLDGRFGTGGKVRTDFFGGEDAGHALDVKGDEIVVVGSAQNGADPNDFAAALYDRRGRLDPEFGTGGKATLNIGADDVANGGGFGPRDTVVAAGDTYTGATDQFAVARWTEEGQPDPRFGTGGFTTTAIGGFSGAFAMSLGPENKLVAAGYSDSDFAVARYLNK